MVEVQKQKKVIQREERIYVDMVSPKDLMEMLENEAKIVLPEFKDSIRFEVKTFSEPYDSSTYAGFFMVYNDYENDEECEKRIAQENYWLARQEEQDRLQFERLSKKFAQQPNG